MLSHNYSTRMRAGRFSAPASCRPRTQRQRVRCTSAPLETEAPGVADTSDNDSQSDEPRELRVGVLSTIPQLAGAIASEVNRFNHAHVESTSSQNHLKAVCALATAQSMVQSDGGSFTARLAFHNVEVTDVEVTEKSTRLDRWMRTLKIDVHKCTVRECVPPEQLDSIQLLMTKAYSSEQLLLDAVVHALHSQPDRPVLLVARGDTPINRATRMVARLQQIAPEQELPHLELYPCNLPMMDTVTSRVVSFVGFLFRQSAPAST